MTSRLHDRAAALAALLLTGVALAVGAAEVVPDFARAGKVADGSLVRVRSTVADGMVPQGPATFTNTGFLVSPDGYVLTSLLAVAGCSQVHVVAPDGSALDARVVAMDQAAGLALLKCDLADATPLLFASELPAVGQWVALGFVRPQAPPGADAATADLEPARVADMDASIHLNGFRWNGLVCASTRACYGCAAGPLLDAEGRVVGVVIAARCAQAFGPVMQTCEAYGLPADQVQTIVERMRRGESRRLGWLGVAVAQEPGNREGARVAAVLESSPAHLAGIRPGDVILEINGSPIEAPIGVAETVAEAGPASGVKIKLLRDDGHILQVAADLQPRPLAICSTPTRSSAEAPLTPQQVLQENGRLRERVAELEATCRQLEARVRQLEAGQDR